MIYEVEWTTEDKISGIYMTEDDEKDFVLFIEYCLHHGYEITATARRNNK